MNCTNELLNWGRSANVYPQLVFTRESTEELATLQDSLQLAYPDGTKVEELSVTLMHFSPYTLFKFMRDEVERCEVDPEIPIKEEFLYVEMYKLILAAEQYDASVKSKTLKVTEIDLFGKDDVLAVSVQEPQVVKKIRSSFQLTALHELGHLGLDIGKKNSTHKEKISSIPELDWLLNDSTPYIPLVNLPESAHKVELPKLDFPAEISIAGLSLASK